MTVMVFMSEREDKILMENIAGLRLEVQTKLQTKLLVFYGSLCRKVKLKDSLLLMENITGLRLEVHK